jgi:hypothetical protein
MDIKIKICLVRNELPKEGERLKSYCGRLAKHEYNPYRPDHFLNMYVIPRYYTHANCEKCLKIAAGNLRVGSVGFRLKMKGYEI